MRYSANLNVIIKAIEKASIYLIRDFNELENLQSSPDSADRFGVRCYDKVKKVLIEEFQKLRPDFNIYFDDGSKIVNNKDPEYFYHISAINGLDNLLRANPNFSIVVSLIHKNKDVKEPISIAINNIYQKELFYCEKGFGAYLNNRKIRCSKRKNNLILVGDNNDKLKINHKSFQALGSTAIEIAYLAAAKFDIGVFKKSQFSQDLALLYKEAGGKIEQNQDYLIFKNS